MIIEKTTDQVELVKDCFRRIDSGEFPHEMFTRDFQFFFPKYGIGSGPAEFRALADGLQVKIERLVHRVNEFMFIENGSLVVVEGTTEGESNDGRKWSGGHTAGGRFCSVFAFNVDGLIERIHVYLDPDYLSEDSARFLWNRGDSVRW